MSHPRRTHRSREKEWGDLAIIHRTVRWCTGLFGEPTAPAPTVVRVINARHVAAPTVGWVHRTVRCAPDSVRCANRFRGATVDCALIWKEITHQTCYSGCLVAHRIVRCATRQKAMIAFHVDLQRLLAALGL
jgi:hypothetical protein